MAVKCSNCGGDHPRWDCKRPARVARAEAVMSQPVSKQGAHGPVPDSQKDHTESTAALMEAQRSNGTASGESVLPRPAPVEASQSGIHTYAEAAGTQALPVDTYSEPLTLPVGEKQPRTSQPQGTRNEGMPTPFNKTDYQRKYMAKWRKGLVGNKHKKEEG